MSEDNNCNFFATSPLQAAPASQPPPEAPPPQLPTITTTTTTTTSTTNTNLTKNVSATQQKLQASQTPPTKQKQKDEHRINRRTRSQTMLNPVKQSDYSKLPQSSATTFLSQFAATLPRVLPSDWKEGDLVGPSMIRGIKYKINALLGKGSSSRCYGIVEYPTPDGPPKAVKVVKSLEEDDLRDFKNEILLWSTFQIHPNILPLLDWIIDDKHGPLTMIGAITLQARGGTLLDFFLNSQSSLKEEDLLLIMRSILTSLHHLHDKEKVVHRDIKLENIFLLDSSSLSSLCLGDFGLSEHIVGSKCDQDGLTGNASTTTTSKPLKGVDFEKGLKDSGVSPGPGVGSGAGVGSMIYISPEELESEYRRSIYGKTILVDLTKADIWSVGVVLYSLMEGRFPFEDSYSPRLQALIRRASYKKPSKEKGWSIDLLGLLDKMLEKNPLKRPGALELLDYDPFLAGYNK